MILDIKISSFSHLECALLIAIIFLPLRSNFTLFLRVKIVLLREVSEQDVQWATSDQWFGLQKKKGVKLVQRHGS